MKKNTKKIISMLAALTIAASASFAVYADDKAEDTKTVTTVTAAADETKADDTKADAADEAKADDTKTDAADEAKADDTKTDAADETKADDTKADTADEAKADDIDYSKFDTEGIDVVVLGQKVEFDVQPEMMNDRVMVPVRAIFEALGAVVNWDDDTQTITAVKGDNIVLMQIGNTKMFVNNKECEPLDAAPVLKNDSRTLVPVRAISEAFDYDVNWDEKMEMVIVSEKKAEDTTKTDETKADAADETKADDTKADAADETKADETKADAADETKADDTNTAAEDETKTQPEK